MIDFGTLLARGDGVWWGQAAAEPRPLVDALIAQSARIGPIRTFTGLSWNDQLAVTMPARMSMVSYGGLGELRELSRSGRLEVIPCHYSALPRMFAERLLPCDVGLVQVSPPDENGRCSLGIGVDYVAADSARPIRGNHHHRPATTRRSHPRTGVHRAAHRCPHRRTRRRR